jgi:hypothetical protein
VLGDSPLTKTISLFSIADIITDAVTRCPQMGELLGLHTFTGKRQSRDLVITLMRTVDKKTKKNVLVFDWVFDFLRKQRLKPI